MKAESRTAIEVMDTLENFADAYSRRDMVDVLDFFVPDTDLVVIGTGIDETHMGQERLMTQFERDWAQAEEVSMDFGWHAVSASGAVAWVAANCLFRAQVNGEKIEVSCRFTSVLEKRSGKWLIAQTHFSLPHLSHKKGESFPASH